MTITDLERQADALASTRDFAGARQLLSQVVAQDRTNFAAWMKLAAMTNAMGDARASLQAAEGALTVRPLDFMALLMRAMQLYALGQTGEAGNAYGKALAQAPDHIPPQMEPVIQAARDRYRVWQDQQAKILSDAVTAVTPMTDKLEQFIASTVRIAPMERDGPTHYCYPGLGETGFFDRAHFPWFAALEAATEVFETEFNAVVGAEAAELVPYIQYPAGIPVEQWATLNHNRDWTAIHLIQNGRRVEHNARHCPQVMQMLQNLPQPSVAGAGPNAMFSLLAPGAHIPPHTGVANTRLVCHLPLIVPPGCWFRVGNDKREWQKGQAWVFDDTVEHEAMNPSEQLRVVFICDVWHPALDRAGASRYRRRDCGGRTDSRSIIMLLDDQYQSLHHRLSSLAAITMAEVNAATDFAIDANAAGRADYSISLLQPLADKMPHIPKIWQLLGLAWREEQEMEKAAMAFDRAAALAPQDARIAMGKAQVAFERGSPAAEQFQQIRTIAPQDGELALSAAAALVQEGNAEAGEALIETLVSQNPGWLRGHDWLATTRWMMGDTEDFARSYAAAITAFPADKAIRMACYRAVAQPGCWDLAERVLEDARVALGNRLEFTAAEAKIASETGDDDRAEKLFDELAAINDPGIAIAHIRHCLRTGQIARAEDLAAPLVDTPAASAVWPYMSAIWRLTGDDRSAWLDGDPAYIRQVDLSVSAQQLEDLAERLRTLHQSHYHPPEQSLRGGTQTQGHLFLRAEPEYQAIKAMIRDAVRDYVDVLPPAVPGHPLLGTPRSALLYQGAWSVRLHGQGFHVVHTHPMGWISSAFYVALPEKMGDDQAGWLQLGAPPPDLRTGLAPYQMIEPKPGRLALFPSTMWHGTMPFDDGERLTIAFDIRVPTR